MVHEVLHCYLTYNGVAQNQLTQHLNIAQNYVSSIRDILEQEFDISNHDANCLILEGLSDLLNTSVYNGLLQSLNLVESDVQETAYYEKNGLIGTSCGT